jgi:type I restriction enzyme S subunit
LIPQKDKLDVDYLFYNLKLNRQNGTGSGQPQITIPEIAEKIISVPPLLTQQKIAYVLSTLDSKIELNNKIISELEAMAKTIYDYWFVQFDFPNAKGKPYKTSGGKMVWNEELKREIPDLKDWKIGTLLDIADYSNGLPCQKFRPNGVDFLRVIKIREMNEGFSANTEFVRTDIPEKAIIENGDILFSWSASLEVKIWTGGKGALNQHIFKVTSENYPKSFYYNQLLNYLQHFKMMAELRKTTMGHITQDHLRESRITIPPIEIINELDKIIKPILEKKVKLEIENELGEAILYFTFLVISFAIIRGLFMYFMRQTIIVMSRKIEYDLKNEIFNHYQQLDQTFYRNNRIGDLMSRISEDVSRVRMYVGPALMYSINLVITIILVLYCYYQ